MSPILQISDICHQKIDDNWFQILSNTMKTIISDPPFEKLHTFHNLIIWYFFSN